MKRQQRIDKALDIAFRHGEVSTYHQNRWVIDQMVRALAGDGYQAWVVEYETDDGTGDKYKWQAGVKP